MRWRCKNMRMGRWRLSRLRRLKRLSRLSRLTTVSRSRMKVMCRLNMPSMIRTQEEIVTWLNFPSNIV